MSRKAYDSIHPDQIPPDADIVFYYIGGQYEWSPEDIARFPGKLMVGITEIPSVNSGTVCVIEDRAFTFVQAVEWVKARRLMSVDPSVDVEASQWDAARQQFADSKVDEPHWLIAHFGADPNVIPDGAVGLQYQSTDAYDTWAIADYWPGVDPPSAAPAPGEPAPAQPVQPEVIDVQVPELVEGATGPAVVTLQAILNAKALAGLTVDGIFGPMTLQHVQGYQSAHGLAVDGIVGPQTWQTLATG